MNPDAVGVLLSNANIALIRFAGAGQYALYAKGTIKLVGLDGLVVEGTAIIEVNTTNTAVVATLNIPGEGAVALNLPAGVAKFVGDGVKFAVKDVFELSGKFSFTKLPTGKVQVLVTAATPPQGETAKPGAGVRIFVGGQEAFSIYGTAIFSMGGAEGFQLQSLRVADFSVFGQSAGLAPAGGGSVQFPTADLANPFSGKIVDRAVFNTQGYIDIVLNDLNGVGFKETLTIKDTAQEFEIKLNGAPVPGLVLNGNPTKQTGNVYRYFFTGSFP